MTLFGDFVTGQNVSFQRARNALRRMPFGEGIVSAGDFAVGLHTPNNMSVDVAVGEAWVNVDSGTKNGIGHVYSDAVVNVPITAAHATLPRVDRIVLQWNDSAIPAGVGGNVPTVRSVDGTATSGATLANLTGAAAEPNDSLTLGFVLVPAASGSVSSTSNIGGYIDPVNTGRGAVAGAPPLYSLGAPAGYLPHCEAFLTASTSWANSVLTTVALGSEVADAENMHDTVTNNSRITVKTPGKYLTIGSVDFVVNAGRITARILENGATTIRDAAAAAASAFDNGLQAIRAGAPTNGGRYGYGDYFELQAMQISGAAANLNAGGGSALSVTWLGV